MPKEVHPKKRWFLSNTLDGDVKNAVMNGRKEYLLVMGIPYPRKTCTNRDEQHNCANYTEGKYRVVEQILLLKLMHDHEDYPSYTGDCTSAVDTTEML